MPPPPPPPAPGLPSFTATAAVDPNARGQLLNSIKQGKKLRKTTQINDRSAPNVGKVVSSNSDSRGISNSGSISNSGPGHAPGPIGLGGLFAGGMPKLKPVGSGGHSASSGGSQFRAKTKDTSSSNIDTSPSMTNRSPRLNNFHGSSQLASSSKPPPPPPPSQNVKPYFNNNNNEMGDRKQTYGKPTLAPKPPGIIGNNGRPKPELPPKQLPGLGNGSGYRNNGTLSPSAVESPTGGTAPSIGRTQSARMPKSLINNGNSTNIGYRTVGRSTGKEMSACPPPPPRFPPQINSRGKPPLKAPAVKPPPPPPIPKQPPSNPPPPPPPISSSIVSSKISPRPPPPTRNIHMSTANGIQNGGSNAPPPPPSRNASMRSPSSAPSLNSFNSSSDSISSSNGNDLEARFGHFFSKIEYLRRPTEFTGKTKTYPSRTRHSSKQQPAPLPPAPTYQLSHKMYPNNTSMC